MLHRNVAQKIFANARGTSTHPWSCDPSAIYLYETTPRGITKSWCKMLGKWKGDPPTHFSECPKPRHPYQPGWLGFPWMFAWITVR
jgi:hypothetical protein